MKKNRATAFFLAVFLFALALPMAVSAASAKLTLTASNSVTVGNQVKVTIKITSSEKIGSWLFSMAYDPSALEYVSGADSGGGGAIRFSDSLDSGVTSLTKTVVFKTKKITSTTVSVSSPQIVGFDSLQNMSVSSASKTIKINAKPTYSSDNKLSALSVAEGEITPAFDAGTTAYTMSVPFEVTAITVSSTANHKNASVTVDSPALVVGENTVTVTVKAENGSTKKYTITVTRQQSDLAGATAKVKDKDYSIAYDPNALTVPEGYTATTLPFGEKKILVYAAPQNALYIAYLTSESESAWYVYHGEEQIFTPYISLQTTAAPFVILDAPQGTPAPSGYIPADLTVGDVVMPAYKTEDSEQKGVYIVYAMAKDGTCGFYYYDSKAASFVSYFEVSLPAGSDAEESVEELKSRLEEKDATADKMEISFLIAALAAVVLFIFLILALFFVRRPKKEAEEPLSVNKNSEAFLAEFAMNEDSEEAVEDREEESADTEEREVPPESENENDPE